jgi:hypothetical protein
MLIVCTTTEAAAQVLSILLAAHLLPVRDFEIQPVLSIIPPITYMMLVALSAAQIHKLSAVPDTTISG